MDTFSALEAKVRQAAALVRDLRARNASLEKELPEVRKRNQRLEEELPELRTRVQELHKALEAAEKGVGEVGEDSRKLAAAEQELKGLRQEREEVRVRIARLMEILDALD
jgi:septal ring factor EnvC (AmiA/AmiB activator)